MVSGIQLLGILFGLITSYLTFVNFKRKEFTLREFIGWEIIWVMFVLVTVFPQRFKVVATNFGAVRPLDFFTIVGFVLVLSIAFYTYVNVDRLRKRLEKTIRDLALTEVQGERTNEGKRK